MSLRWSLEGLWTALTITMTLLTELRHRVRSGMNFGDTTLDACAHVAASIQNVNYGETPPGHSRQNHHPPPKLSRDAPWINLPEK